MVGKGFSDQILGGSAGDVEERGRFDWIEIEVIQGQDPNSKGCRSHSDDSMDGDTVKFGDRNSADGQFEDRRKAAEHGRRFC